ASTLAASSATGGAAASSKASSAFIPLSCPMVRMAGKDAGGAKQLFEQHCSRQQVRPGGLAEGEQQVGTLALRRAVPVGRPEHEARLANAVIAPVAEYFGEFLRAELPPALVEQNGAAWSLRFRHAAAAVGQFGYPERPADALFVARDQLGLGRTADLSARDHMEQHGRPLAAHVDERNVRRARRRRLRRRSPTSA